MVLAGPFGCVATEACAAWPVQLIPVKLPGGRCLSHASELRDFPATGSYVAEVERAVSAAGHVIVDMADFPAADQPPAQLCIDRVRSCTVMWGCLELGMALR